MSSESKSSDLPTVLILGGCGFIGRTLANYFASNNLAKKIVVADKSLPGTCPMTAQQKALFENKDLLEFKQSDLSKDQHIDRVFTSNQYDYVFNCCGETRFGMPEEDYRVKCFVTAEKCAKAAASKQPALKKWIEVSTAQVYQPDEKPSAEDAKIKPWTIQAKYRLEAENAVKAAGIPYVILRPAIVYGVGDLTGLTPRIACSAVYKEKKEKMKFLWDKGLKQNVVHVEDVVRAAWLSALHAPAGSIFNLADEANLDQGTLNAWLGTIFHIETGFHGTIASNLAKLALGTVADDANDDHVPIWTNLCMKHKILNTPLSPFIDKELLYNHHLCVNGSKIGRDLKGFKYLRKASQEGVEEQIAAFIEMGLFPPVL